jgi:hypothetical protein
MNPRLDEVREAVREIFPLANWGGRVRRGRNQNIGWLLVLTPVPGGDVAVVLDNEKTGDALTFSVGVNEDPCEVVARQLAAREAVAA